MQQFRFSSSYNQNVEIEDILRRRRRATTRQQIIFAAIFAAIVLSLAMYLFRKVRYTEFDGYMNTDFVKVRAVQDILVHRIFKRTGDVLKSGDTLFSYVYLNHFTSSENQFNEPTVVIQNRDMRTQYQLAAQELAVLRVRIQELERQLATQDHNISFGLADNAGKMKLEKDLKEAREELRARQRKLGVLRRAAEETQDKAEYAGVDGKRSKFFFARNSELMKQMGLMRYAVCSQEAVVTNVTIPNNMEALRGEEIMQYQPMNLKESNLSITCLVPPNKMNRINRNSLVEVVVNDEVSFSAHVTLLGSRTEIIPEHLRRSLSRDYVAVAVNLSLDPGQIVPFWALVKHIPVTIRINNFHSRRRDDDDDIDYIYYDTTTGHVTEEPHPHHNEETPDTTVWKSNTR